MNKCKDLCYQTFSLLAKLGLPNPTKRNNIISLDNDIILRMQYFFSDQDFAGRRSIIVSKWCYDINYILYPKNLSYNIEKVYTTEINVGQRIKLPSFDILFCRIGIATDIPDKRDHSNFVIFDKKKNEVNIYEPNGRHSFFSEFFSEKSVRDYKKLLMKIMGENDLEDTKIEVKIEHKFSEEKLGLQGITGIPFCELFSMYMNIIIFAMYQICDEEEKENIGEISGCVEGMIIDSFENKDDIIKFMYHIGYVLSYNHLNIIREKLYQEFLTEISQ